MSEPHKIIVRVYFAHTTKTKDVAWNDYVRNLACVDGVYLASTERDYRALMPFALDATYSS
jgi:hypothetical protein